MCAPPTLHIAGVEGIEGRETTLQEVLKKLKPMAHQWCQHSHTCTSRDTVSVEDVVAVVCSFFGADKWLWLVVSALVVMSGWFGMRCRTLCRHVTVAGCACVGGNEWLVWNVLQNFVPPSFDDKILEVVAVFGGMQIAVSRLIDIQHHRIAQVGTLQTQT